MKIYLIYVKIPINLYEEKLGHLLVSYSFSFKIEDDYYIGLYAFTKNKKILEDFINRRLNAWKRKLYFYKKVELSKDEYKKFLQKFHNIELAYRIITTSYLSSLSDISYEYREAVYKTLKEIPKEIYNETIRKNSTIKIILCTEFEYIASVETGNVFVLNSYLLKGLPDYTIFNKKYKDALDKIGYTFDFDCIVRDYSGDIDDIYIDDRIELLDYNMSYNVNPLGHTHYATPSESKYNAFINLFYEMLIGYNENDSINIIGCNWW
jgi:hypothetical protein